MEQNVLAGREARNIAFLSRSANCQTHPQKGGTMNQSGIYLRAATLLLAGTTYSFDAQARMGGGGMSIFSGAPTAEECRVCHEDLQRFPQLETNNPGRHHDLIGTPVPEIYYSLAPDAPGGVPGDPYDCTACHTFVWDDAQLNYVIQPFRDCLLCHPASLVTGHPRRGNNVHHRTQTFQQRNCRACHGRGMGGGGR